METLEAIVSRIAREVPGAEVEILPNPPLPSQASLLLGHARAVEVAAYLRDAEGLKFDFCSNMTGVDWPERVIKTSTKTKQILDGVEKEVVETTGETQGGCLEAVYHLYSIALRQGPLVIRMRTADRAEQTAMPSLTGVWKSAEFQEREAYDLYGIVFTGHPDLRRILMWDEFEDFPMRKDYVEPDDYEYEPTAHDEVAAKAKQSAERRAHP